MEEEGNVVTQANFEVFENIIQTIIAQTSVDAFEPANDTAIADLDVDSIMAIEVTSKVSC